MTKEIRRNDWSRFCKEFSAVNQFRQMAISLSGKGAAVKRQQIDQPFLGLALEKSNRKIDGFQLFVGRPDAGSLTEALLSVKQPEKLMVEKDEEGKIARLKLRTRDGRELQVEMSDSEGSRPVETFVQQVAYSLFERRGHSNGGDLDDWLTAERLVHETGQSFTQ